MVVCVRIPARVGSAWRAKDHKSFVEFFVVNQLRALDFDWMQLLIFRERETKKVAYDLDHIYWQSRCSVTKDANNICTIDMERIPSVHRRAQRETERRL